MTSWWELERNPHLRQLGNRAPSVLSQLLRDYQCPGSPTIPYRRRNRELKSVCHWGQRKLILSEIEFFTEYTSPWYPALVLYAGAAPGHHILLLSEMFPKLHFILVDPSAFEIEETDRIRIRNEFFTSGLALQLQKEWSSKFVANADYDVENQKSERDEASQAGGAASSKFDTFFISDVRTADWTLMSSEEVDAAVLDDLRHQVLLASMPLHRARQPASNAFPEHNHAPPRGSQRAWHEALRPTRSLLKFR